MSFLSFTTFIRNRIYNVFAQRPMQYKKWVTENLTKIEDEFLILWDFEQFVSAFFFIRNCIIITLPFGFSGVFVCKDVDEERIISFWMRARNKFSISLECRSFEHCGWIECGYIRNNWNLLFAIYLWFIQASIYPSFHFTYDLMYFVFLASFTVSTSEILCQLIRIINIASGKYYMKEQC